MINALKLTLLLKSSNIRVCLPLILHSSFRSNIQCTVHDLLIDAISGVFNYVPLQPLAFGPLLLAFDCF